MILLAHLRFAQPERERRGSDRMESGAILSVGGDQAGAQVMVLNLSSTGLRLYSQAKCPVGERLRLEIPGTRPVMAEVVWQDGDQFGCKFDEPLTRGEMSAFILRSPVYRGTTVLSDENTEIRLGKNAEEIARWVRNFEAEESGRTISGFRVNEDGDIVAIVTESP